MEDNNKILINNNQDKLGKTINKHKDCHSNLINNNLHNNNNKLSNNNNNNFKI